MAFESFFKETKNKKTKPKEFLRRKLLIDPFGYLFHQPVGC
jgi:hypothetical protein